MGRRRWRRRLVLSVIREEGSGIEDGGEEDGGVE